MTLLPDAGEPAQEQKPPAVAPGRERTFDLCRPWVVAAALFLASGCSESVRAVADGPTDRATKVEELSDAVAARFTNPERSGPFETMRRRMISGALHPSRVFSDTGLWTSSPNANTRSLWAH